MYGFGLIEQDEDDWLICPLLSPLLSMIGECPVLSGLLSEQHRYCGALFKTIPCYSIVSQAYRMSVCPSVCPSVCLSVHLPPPLFCLSFSLCWLCYRPSLTILVSHLLATSLQSYSPNDIRLRYLTPCASSHNYQFHILLSINLPLHLRMIGLGSLVLHPCRPKLLCLNLCRCPLTLIPVTIIPSIKGTFCIRIRRTPHVIWRPSITQA